jgi:hypothetical protein
MGGMRRHLTYANVMATIAVFLVLSGGTAVALTGSNTVQSDDLGPGAQVQAPDVAANAVGGPDVTDNSLAGADVNEASLGTVPNASKVGGLAPSALTRGRAKTSVPGCDPDSSTFVDCGAVTVNLARTSRVLIVTSAMWYVGGNFSAGTCRIGVDGAPFGPNVFPGQDMDTTSPDTEQSLTLTNVTGPLPAGSHTFGLACNEFAGGIDFDQSFVSVALLGSG